MDFVGDGFQVGHDLRVAKCAVTHGEGDVVFLLFDLERSHDVEDGVLVVGCKPARSKILATDFKCGAIS